MIRIRSNKLSIKHKIIEIVFLHGKSMNFLTLFLPTAMFKQVSTGKGRI